MEKVDTLIDLLAENISEKIKEEKEKHGEIAEKTKALAELISARNQIRRKENAESVKETKYKISVEGAEEYKEVIREIKNAVIEYREEIDKLNASLEREIELSGNLNAGEKNQIDLFADQIDMCITEECKKLKNAANPKDELKKYIRQIRWKNPELAVYLQRRMSRVLNLDN